jgi:hypothetical protein
LIGAGLAPVAALMAQAATRAVGIDGYVEVRADLFKGWNVR